MSAPDITPEQIEACRLHIEAEHASGRPDAVEGETVLAIIAVCQRLMGDVLSLSAKLDAPCGSCHPCTNYADETWRAAGRTPPHVHEWDELRAEGWRLEGRLNAAEAIMEPEYIRNILWLIHANDHRLRNMETASEPQRWSAGLCLMEASQGCNRRRPTSIFHRS